MLSNVNTLQAPSNGRLFPRSGNRVVRLSRVTAHETGYNRHGKRILDVIVSTVLLFVFAPVMLCVAIVVRLTSRGPALFIQDRYGEGGSTFKFLKFRTMTSEEISEEVSQHLIEIRSHGELYKEEHDPRLTSIGPFLRRTSLDELPQLWNVLRGDISLVGPRPLMPELFDGHPRERLLRSRIKPGITGYWQVFERGRCMRLVDMVELDMQYQRDISFKTDVKVLLLTIPAVFSRRGAM